jgi:hypothetical protein
MELAAIGLFLILGSLGLFCLVFWIWTIVDCASNEPSEGNDKLIWILVILFVGIIGSIIYVAVRRPERRRLTGR